MTKKKPMRFQYDPSLPYQWNPDDEFKLTGIEFEYMFKFLTEYLNTPESSKVIRAYETHRILEQKLKEGVEEGKIKPQIHHV